MLENEIIGKEDVNDDDFIDDSTAQWILEPKVIDEV